MLRKLQIAVPCILIAVLVFTHCRIAMGTETYELGPYIVEGIGATPQAAEDDAYAEMAAKVAIVASSLPPGHTVQSIVIDSEGLILPTLYEIEFHLIIAEPSSGGGGNGPGSGGPG